MSVHDQFGRMGAADSARLDWMGAHYARFLGAVTCDGRTKTTVQWEVTEHEVIALRPWEPDAIETTAEGDFRAAIDAAMQQDQDMLAAARAAGDETEFPAHRSPSPGTSAGVDRVVLLVGGTPATVGQ